MMDMTITDTALLNALDGLSSATGRDSDTLIVEILRNFFWPAYKHELIREFRWRIDVIGGEDIDTEIVTAPSEGEVCGE
jgi:hypothetical protein